MLDKHSFDKIFAIFGKELPAKSAFFGRVNDHGITLLQVENHYSRGNKANAWPLFVEDYNKHVAGTPSKTPITPKVTPTPNKVPPVTKPVVNKEKTDDES